MKSLQLRFGMAARNEKLFIQRNVSKIEVHKSYNASDTQAGFDIALLKLDKIINFQKNIIPICLPNQDESFIGTWNKIITGITTKKIIA